MVVNLFWKVIDPNDEGKITNLQCAELIHNVFKKLGTEALFNQDLFEM